MKALIFDFDGLIVDSEYPEFECWRKVWADEGHELKAEEWVQVIGTAGHIDFKDILEGRLGRPIEDWASKDAARIAQHQAIMEGQELLPGVEALMRQGRAQGWRIGVASSSSARWVEGGLQRYGLMGYVEAVRTRDRVENHKPHPEPYLKTLEDLGAKAELSFAFEDSATGVSAAKAAGLTVIAVPNSLTKLHDLSHAHQILESLLEFKLPG